MNNEMTQLPIEMRTAAPPPVIAGKKGERVFYTGMAIVIAATVLAGFSQRYFLRSFFNTEPLSPLLHLHAIVNTSWIVIYLVQTALVPARRISIHRRLGMAGSLIALSVILVGTAIAIIRAQQGASLPGIPPLVFLAVPLGDIVVFSILVGSDIFYRRRPDVHKRLMLLATISILSAAVARLPFAYLQTIPGATDLFQAGLPAIYGTTDLFIVACLIYDLISRKRIHRATVLGGLLIVVSQPMRLVIAGTNAWLAFATWLTQLVAWIDHFTHQLEQFHI